MIDFALSDNEPMLGVIFVVLRATEVFLVLQYF